VESIADLVYLKSPYTIGHWRGDRPGLSAVMGVSAKATPWWCGSPTG